MYRNILFSGIQRRVPGQRDAGLKRSIREKRANIATLKAIVRWRFLPR